MDDEKQSLDDLIPSRNWVYLFGVLALVSVYFCLGIRMDNRHQNMLNPNSEETRIYEAFQEMFGNDDFVIIGISGKPILDEAGLDAMYGVLEELESAPFVKSVDGIPTVYRDRFGAEDPEALADEILSTQFYRNLFISEDGTIAGLLLHMLPFEGAGDRELLVEGLEAAVQPLRDYGFRVDLIGGPIFNVRMNRLSIGESLRIFPIAAVCSILVLLIAVRSVRAILAVLLCGVFTLLYTFSLVGMSGQPLNVVTSMLPIILWVLAIANCIHLVCRYQYYRGEGLDTRDGLNAALRDVRRACVLSAVTTAFGFISLTLADIGPVAELGYLMFAGLLVSLAVNLLLGPHFILWMKVPKPRGKHVNRDHVFEAIGAGAYRHRTVILIGFGALTLAGVYGASQIKTEPDTLNFMPADSETVLSYNYIMENLTGAGTLEVIIDTPGGWLNDEYWEPIQALQAGIGEVSDVARVVSPFDFLKKVHQWDNDLDPEFYRLPDSGEHARELLDYLEPEEKSELTRLATEDGEHIRVTVLLNSMKSSGFRRVFARAEEEVANLPEPLSAYMTGMGYRMQNMQKRMVATQVKTFSLAFVLVFICIFIGLRSVRGLFVAVWPNLFPILTVFFTMYLLGVTLDAATVMVASIALGIAVDDTVHLMTAIHQELGRGVPYRDAVVQGVVKVGASVSITTAAATAGFFTLSTSLFVPVAYFGLLAGIAMIMALIADLWLVPALYSIGAGAQSDPVHDA